MKVRQLERIDASSYRSLRLEGLKLYSEAFASSYEEEQDLALEEYEEKLSQPNMITLGAFDAGQLCGVVTLQKVKLIKMKHRIHILAMYVSEEKRQKGVAKCLIKEAIQTSKQLDGIEQLHLTVVSVNEPAKKLYQSFGFETYGFDKKALKINQEYYDEELMVLNIESS
ncbi:GNAT family N-acetyltransferase [Alkalihalobacillus trypoxylicola]|uniref:Acetyltransferase n=1 Tax=Alkalihalobacillus trypoxylicola TaxID=519424 RepID=A0A161PW88_9BACI|nr:GNAT family N-acetyltransferase [Alkalihalobacillus trypoxylicola]KYG26070.1 acetyltransferase [Alkalihalobacillus trypoxylicola]